MNRITTSFLKNFILLLAVGAAATLIRFPLTEGRAVNLDLLSIYMDPLILYMYGASIPFFVALYQGLKLLRYVERNELFSCGAIAAVRTIKYCGVATIGLLAVAILLIRVFAQGDDPAGPTMLGLVAIVFTAVIVAAAAYFQKKLLTSK